MGKLLKVEGGDSDVEIVEDKKDETIKEEEKKDDAKKEEEKTDDTKICINLLFSEALKVTHRTLDFF